MGNLPPEINQEGARKDLEEIQAVFDSFGVRLFLTYGALLGIYRDKNFIPYDDDIDLCVIDEIDYKTRKQIGQRLEDIGYTPQPIAFKVVGRMEQSEPGYNGDNETGIIVCQKRIRTTIFFFKRENCPIHGEDYTCFPKLGSGRLIFTPAHFFDKPNTIKFKGKKYLTPNPIKGYLEFMYGKDWKKPIKGKHAPQWEQAHQGMINTPNYE